MSYEMVEVIWDDSAQLDGGDWITNERIDSALEDGLKQRSVGYLVRRDKGVIVLARSVSMWKESSEKFEGVLAIPLACVERILVLSHTADVR